MKVRQRGDANDIPSHMRRGRLQESGQRRCSSAARQPSLLSIFADLNIEVEMTAPPDATLPSRLVLVVEDDPEMRQFYSDIFEREGFVIEQAHNGFQAFEKALTRLPDLVLTDIAVPGMDGIELCRRLRADGRTRGIPLLAITGYGDRHYLDRAMVAGADHVLAKPCDATQLVSEARRLMK
jgi:Response regulators consisting of a CheY-like receiver domain and a winged-helix DNA-binding domain